MQKMKRISSCLRTFRHPSDDDEWVDRKRNRNLYQEGQEGEIPKPPGSSRLIYRASGRRGFTVGPPLSSIPMA